MEVDLQGIGEIVDQMIQMEFQGNFKEVAFNQFIRLQSIDQLVMNKVFNAQQEFLRSTTTMLSTANATQDRTLTHTRMLGRFVVAATIGQVSTTGGVPKTRCLAYQMKIEPHTLTRTRPTANRLKGGKWAKQTQQ